MSVEGDQRDVRAAWPQAGRECALSQQRRRHVHRRLAKIRRRQPISLLWLTSLTADFDHDGWPDIYVACDSTASLLFHNNHDGTFAEIGKRAGVAYNEDGTEQAGMGLSADDFTHSGYQGIIKTNFSDDTPTLYLNRGDDNFDEVTYSAGLGKIKTWLGWGVQFYDFDNNGWPGIFIANGHVYPEVEGKAMGTSYRQPKVAYYNLRDGTFFNITPQAGTVLSELQAGEWRWATFLTMVTKRRW